MSQVRNINRRPATSAVLRDERPYSARSVIASTLLGVHPPRLSARALVRAGALFGIADGTVRVAVSRMVSAGELEADDGHYALAGTLRERQQRQERSRSGEVEPWNGRWRTEIIVADAARSATDRSELRTALSELRLAEWREGVWLRPDNLPTTSAPRSSGRNGRPATAQPHGSGAEAIVRAQCRRLEAEPADDAAALAAELWDLGAWSERARLLHDAIDELLGPLEGGAEEALSPGFVVSAATLRHFQSDPLLPSELLPDDWPGPALRKAYERYDAAFKATLTAAHASAHKG